MASSPTLTEEGTSRYRTVDGVKVHYNEAGSGAPVVMLHGGGPGASGWSNFGTNFGPLAEQFRVILMDLPGFGKSDSVVVTGPRAAYNARILSGLLKQLDVPKAHLIGNSLGGATSAKTAIDFPDQVDKLVLMGAAGGGVSYFVPPPPEGIKLLNDVFNNPTREGMERMIRVFVYDSSFLTPELLEQRFRATVDNPGHLEARKKSTAGIEDLSAELSKIKAKTLLIWGRDDRFVPLDHGLSALWRIPDAQLHVYSKCGHWAQYEKSAEFNRLVTDFLTH
ncbi:MAG TPA: alpha/beta fold hydrolase [Chloroflexota bacterium]|jgi:2,6-dioxo-6-phenylhexa-3-enoate hydrolase